MDKDITSRPIYDKEGKLVGNITGRKEEIERFSNRDLNDQLQHDRRRHRDNLNESR